MSGEAVDAADGFLARSARRTVGRELVVNVPDGVVAQYARKLGRGLVALGQSASAGQMEGIDAGRPRRESDLEPQHVALSAVRLCPKRAVSSRLSRVQQYL